MLFSVTNRFHLVSCFSFVTNTFSFLFLPGYKFRAGGWDTVIIVEPFPFCYVSKKLEILKLYTKKDAKSIVYYLRATTVFHTATLTYNRHGFTATPFIISIISVTSDKLISFLRLI